MRTLRSSCATLALLFALPAFAVDGTVVNKTTGKPQPGAAVTVFKLGGASGMEPADSTKSDDNGRFATQAQVQGPQLVQAEFEGVTYSRMIQPGEPVTNIALDVYNVSRKQPAEAKVSQHMVLFEPGAGTMTVNESIMWQNSGNVTYSDPAAGTLKFQLPDAAKGQVRVNCTPPGGMPLQREAEKTSQPNVYKVDFPVKPGETRFDLTYEVPYQPPADFAGKVLHTGGLTRLVVPAGVTLTGDNLEPEGKEPRTQASIFTLTGTEYKVRIEGTGSIRQEDAAQGDEDSRPGIEQILPRIHDRVYWVLGLSFAILAIGFYLFYRRGTPEPEKKPAAPAARGKRA